MFDLGVSKSAIFVLATLGQLELMQNRTHILVMCHTTEFVLKIRKEYERLSSYMTELNDVKFTGDHSIEDEARSKKTPHILVGTADQLLNLYSNTLNVEKINIILVECDKIILDLGK